MKIAITADLQIQSQPRYSVLRPDGLSSRLHDLLDCLSWIVKTARADGCTELFVLGDLFDSRTVIDVSVIDAVCRTFRDLSEQLGMHLLVGNHDAYLRTPSLTSLQMLRSDRVTVHESVGLHKAARTVFVPWCDDPEDYCRLLLQAAEMKADTLCSHGMFEGSVPMAKGHPIAWLTDHPWKNVFLGDVHDPVILRRKPNLIRYVGAPMQHHFGDAGQQRGFVIFDTDTGRSKFVENTQSPRFHKIASLDEEIEPATERDFFRVVAKDLDESSALVVKCKKLSTWVESEAVPDVVTTTRIRAAGSLTEAELLKTYCGKLHVPPEALVPLGLDILAEARSCS